jgi:hypothetical protein
VRRLACALSALLLAGCGGSGDGGSASFEPADVERAFSDAGITLRKLPSAGAEQPAMGETSACGTRYVSARQGVFLTVAVCDDAEAAAGLGAQHAGNVAVEYAGDDADVRTRVDRALDSLER